MHSLSILICTPNSDVDNYTVLLLITMQKNFLNDFLKSLTAQRFPPNTFFMPENSASKEQGFLCCTHCLNNFHVSYEMFFLQPDILNVGFYARTDF